METTRAKGLDPMAPPKGPRQSGGAPKELPLTQSAFEKAIGRNTRTREMVWRRRRDGPLKTVLATHPKLSVLIVHDDPTARLVMRRALSAMGVPNIADTGEDTEALERIRKRSPDLVVVGYEMAGGLELLQQIRHDDDPTVRALPVIMTVTAPTAKQIGEIGKAGAQDILVTPFSANALARHLIGIFSEPRKHTETPA